MTRIKALFSALSVAALLPVLEEAAHHKSCAMENIFEIQKHPAYPPMVPSPHGYGRRFAMNGRKRGRDEIAVFTA